MESSKRLKQRRSVDLVFDTMGNGCQGFFGTKYERLVVLEGDRVVYEGRNGPDGYDLAELDAFLQGVEL